MRKLFALLLIAATAAGNEISYSSLQSSSLATPLHDRGIQGQGQIIAILDTGLDYMSCYFAEPDNAPPPINTGSPSAGYEWQNVDLSRRKVVAYNFLYSCQQFPGAVGCDVPGQPDSWDNQGHGTHAAGSAAGDKGAPISHDFADAIAPAAKLIVQDAGFIGGDNCAQRPGIRCPVQITPILDQAYKQGARIHVNPWGDRQDTQMGSTPPTANYSQAARDVDAFVFSHPDMLVVFNTGNSAPGTPPPPASSVSAPGSAKNTLQVGGTRGLPGRDDSYIGGGLIGPTRDGRIKPDLVGPAWVTAGDARVVLDGSLCGASDQTGTSWAAPTVAGAAALVRQYYTSGFYPSGSVNASNAFAPSAALLKATLIAAARPALRWIFTNAELPAEPAPSYQQGFGFPVLDDALYFAGDRSRLLIADTNGQSGLVQGEMKSVRLNVRPGTRLRAVLVWTDPPGTPASATSTTPQLVNDLDLRLITPAGSILHGNERLHPGQPDRLNNVEGITVDVPSGGSYLVSISADRIAAGPRQGYALVLVGDFEEAAQGARRRAVRR